MLIDLKDVFHSLFGVNPLGLTDEVGGELVLNVTKELEGENLTWIDECPEDKWGPEWDELWGREWAEVADGSPKEVLRRFLMID